MSLFDDITNLLAPHVCVACGLEGSLLCSSCMTALLLSEQTCYRCGQSAELGCVCDKCRSKTQLQAIWPAVSYQGYARRLVYCLKYERAMAAAKPMAMLMAQQCPSSEDSWVVTHVPTTAARIRVRGYDQARLLASAVARQLACPSQVLLRRVTQQHQVGQSGRVRRERMRGGFQVQPRAVVQNRRILLVDDVITTGSTLDAAAAALHEAGATHIEAMVFARA